jgi:Cu-Zn family superoxide dismutase
VAINRGIESAGPHFNPDNQKHGIMSGHGTRATCPIFTSRRAESFLWSDQCGDHAEQGQAPFGISPRGTAIVIHASKDDYKSDPAGNTGDRIACGVIGEGPATVGVSPRP